MSKGKITKVIFLSVSNAVTAWTDQLGDLSRNKDKEVYINEFPISQYGKLLEKVKQQHTNISLILFDGSMDPRIAISWHERITSALFEVKFNEGRMDYPPMYAVGKLIPGLAGVELLPLEKLCSVVEQALVEEETNV